MKHKVKRQAFTLLELLIVIVVIGVLATMILISSSEMISTAKASNIIANLRNLKTAALSWYMDSFDQVRIPLALAMGRKCATLLFALSLLEY